MFYILLDVGLLFLGALTIVAIDLFTHKRKEVKESCIILEFPMERV